MRMRNHIFVSKNQCLIVLKNGKKILYSIFIFLNFSKLLDCFVPRNDGDYFLNIFSIAFPFASSSTSLSRYLIFLMRGSSMSCILYPQILPVMRVRFGCIWGASRKNFSKSVLLSSTFWSHIASYPVSQ